MVQVGRFTLAPFRQLIEGEQPVAIGLKSLRLLSVLAEARGALVTKDELMEAVWPNLIVEENALQAHIVSLRRGTGPGPGPRSPPPGPGVRLHPPSPPPNRARAGRPQPTPPPAPHASVPARGLSARRHC